MFGRRKRSRQAELDDYTVEPMEPRVLLSADALGVDAGVLDPDAAGQANWDLKDADEWLKSLANHDTDDTANLDPARGDADDRVEIVFLDAGVEDGQQLLADLFAKNGSAITQVHLLDSNSEGVDQIAQVLAGQQGIDAIHIISHGAAGQIQLGSGTLSIGSLEDYAGQLNDWGSALADAGDILIYGCNLAADAQGEALVNAIGIMTGADVAASVDQTGHVAQGGDWDLEYRAGVVEATTFAPAAIQTWQGTLAAPIADTNEFLVNDTTLDQQQTMSENRGSLRSVAIAPDGDYVVVWSTQGQDASNWGVYAQRFNSSGTELGAEFQVNSFETNSQYHAAVDMDDAGNFVVVWASENQDGTASSVYARVFNADGSEAVSEFRVNTQATGTQDSPTVAMSGGGSFVVAWAGEGSGDSTGIFARAFNADGSEAVSEFRVNTTTSDTQKNPAVAIDDAGNFVIAWERDKGSDSDVLFQRFAADGTKLDSDDHDTGGRALEATPYSSLDLSRPGLAMDPNGNFTIAWRGTGDDGIWAKSYDSNGAITSTQYGATANAFKVSAGSNTDDTSPSISMDDDGNFIVVYEGSGDGAGFGVFGQKFDSNSNPIGGEFQINQTVAGTQDQVSVAMLDSDNFVTAWSGNGVGDADGVFARNYGTGVPGIVQAVAPATDNTNEDVPLVFSTGGGNAITVTDSTPANAVLRATLTVTNGVLDLATTVGLISVTGDGTATVVVAGTESAINTALDGLTYTPTPSYSGPANLQLTVDMQSDLEGRYDFTQPGGLGVDSSPGGGDDGTPSGPGAAPDPNVTFDAQRGSDVLVLDGVDDNVIVPGLFGTPTDVTLAAWVNVAAVGGQEVITLGNSIALRLDDGGGGNGVTGFFHDGSTWRHTDSSQFVGGDGWHHVAFTFDDTSNTQVIYIDGVALGTTSYTGSINYALEPNTVIGSLAGASGYWLDGLLDDVRIYDRALGASEIEALANDASSDNVSVSITVDNVNDAPTLGNNAISINQGGGIVLDSSMLSATDVDHADPGLTFTVTGVSNGWFALTTDTSTPITSFDQSDVTAGNVVFLHDGGELAPAYQVSVSDGTDSTVAAKATVTFSDTDSGVLWLSTTGNLSGGNGVPGLDTSGWNSGDILQQAGPNLGFGEGATDGTFSIAFDVANFAPGANINGMHFVTGNISIGATNAISLQAGDLLLTTEIDETFVSNGAAPEANLAVLQEDIFFFRPDKAGDYSKGNFYFLLSDPLDGDTDISALTLVEKDVWVGDVQLSAGDLLLVGDDKDIWSLATVAIDPTLETSYAGAAKLLIAGDDAGVDLGSKISGLDVVESDISGGGQSYDAGTILLAMDGDDSDVGITGKAVDKQDIVALKVLKTTLGAGAGAAQVDATLMFDGDHVSDNDVNFDSGSENLDGLTLTVAPASGNAAPSLDTATLTVNEGETVTLTGAMLSASDLNDNDLGLVFTVSSVNGGQFEIAGDPGVAVTSFTLGQVKVGDVLFVDDGDELAPSFDVEVTDGSLTDGPVAATINFTNVNDEQVLAVNAGTTVLEGSTGTTITAAMLDTTDVDNTAAQVVYTLTGVPGNGTLYLSGTPLVVTNTFTQDDLDNNRVTYDHSGLENFTDSFAFSVDDGAGAVSTGTFAIIITPVSDNNPIADTESFTVIEGGTATEADLDAGTSLLDGDTDADLPGDTLTVNTTPVVDVSHGTLTLNANGTFSYVHDGSENFTDSFTYEVSDGAGGTDTATVTITITPQSDNDPVADTESFTVIEGGTATEADLDAGTSLLDGDTDADLPGDTLTVNTTPIVDVSHGTLTLNANGTFSYVHDGSENFTDSFTYEVSDGAGGTDTATVTITITPQSDNDPVADAESFTVIEGGTATEADLDAGTSLLDGDTDADLPGDTLTVNTTPVVDVSHGTLTLNANGTFSYVHDGSENFTDSFTYEVSDGAGGTDTATVTITITPQSDNDPVADTESFTVIEGGTATEADLDAGTSLLDGDTDADLPGDTLTVNTTPIVDVSHGTLTLNANGTFSYVHDGSENFTDSFTYEVSDGAGGTDTATVTITITPQSDNDPVADAESFTVIEGGTATEADLDAGTSLLDGDTDADLPGDTLTVNTTPVVDVSHGTLTLNANGTFSYVHDGSENFTDSFTYEVSDGAGGTDTATVTITITPQSDNDPVADTESFTVIEGGTATEADLDAGTSLLDGDTDADLPGDTLTVNTTPIVDVSHGTLTLNANGTFSYVHDGSENFTDSFTYQVSDGAGGTDTATVTITITPLNDAPTLVNPIPDQSATEDLAFSFQFASATFNDADAGDSLSYTAQQAGSTPLPGWLIFDGATRTFSGTPLNGDVGALNIEVIATDSGGLTVSDTFDLTIGNVNDAPVLGNNQMTLDSGDIVVLTPAMLSATDVDHAPAGLQFTVSAVSGGQFELTSASGVGIFSFTQAQVTAGDVVFVDDGDNVAPSYSVTVGDTVDSVGPRAATIVFNPPTVVTTITPAPEPVPVIDPAPVPAPDPKPIVPDPPKPDPDPDPEPEPEPDPDPEPEPDPAPEDEPVVGGGDDDPSTSTAAGESAVGPVSIVDFDSGSGSEGGSMQGLLKNLFVRPAALTAMALQQSLPGGFEIDALAKEVRDVLASTEFNSSLDRMRDGVSDATIFHQSVVGSSVAVTTGLSVGYVAWLVRGGVLLSTALSSLPAWQFIDPLPVLARTRDDEDGNDDSLQSIIKEQSERAANKAKEQTEADGARGAPEPGI